MKLCIVRKLGNLVELLSSAGSSSDCYTVPGIQFWSMSLGICRLVWPLKMSYQNIFSTRFG